MEYVITMEYLEPITEAVVEHRCQICNKKLYIDRCLGCGKQYCEGCDGDSGFCSNELCGIY
ncbi:MAG: hypothetical protein PVF58_07415 [Candidatus Methanofastidiosia archaeon]